MQFPLVLEVSEQVIEYIRHGPDPLGRRRSIHDIFTCTAGVQPEIAEAEICCHTTGLIGREFPSQLQVPLSKALGEIWLVSSPVQKFFDSLMNYRPATSNNPFVDLFGKSEYELSLEAVAGLSR